MKSNEQADESKPAFGFLKLMRSPESQELLSDPLAFALLAVVAFRARWRSVFSVEDLQIGEALIGDHRSFGMSRQQYRTRIARLVMWGFITVRTTPKGTVAKLTSAAVFDINLPPPNEHLPNKTQPSGQPSNSREKSVPRQPSTQPTSNQQPTNSQPLTKKEERNNVAVVHARDGTNTAARATAAADFSEEKQAELNAVAQQAGSDPEKLIVALQPHFPDIDVPRELSAYNAWMKKRSKTPHPSGFVRWLGKAQPVLKPPPRKQNSNGAKSPPPPKVSDKQLAEGLKKFKAENRARGLVTAKPEPL